MNNKWTLLALAFLSGFFPNIYAKEPEKSINEKQIIILNEKEKKTEKTAFLGIAVNPSSSNKNELEIVLIAKNSPAEKANLKIGDILLKIDEQKIFNTEQFSALIQTYKPGDKITVTLKQGNQTKVQSIILSGKEMLKLKLPDKQKQTSKKIPNLQMFINGKEINIEDDEFNKFLEVTPNGIIIKENDLIPPEIQRLRQLFRSKQNSFDEMEAEINALLNAQKNGLNNLQSNTQTFYSSSSFQSFSNKDYSVSLSINQNKRDVIITDLKTKKILFEGPCGTQTEIDAIPENIKKIIYQFTKLEALEIKKAPALKKLKTTSNQKTSDSIKISKEITINNEEK